MKQRTYSSRLAIGIALAVVASPVLAEAPKASPDTTAGIDLPKPAPLADLVKKIDIPYQMFTLKNGLRVIVNTDKKAPIVAVSVWYDVGSKDEPKGKTGFAHLFEHLMFNGSENAQGDFFTPLRKVGATDFNGTTNGDRTNYFETVPRPALDRALFLESDRMGYLTGAITQGVLDEQRGVVQNEKRQGDNRPYGLLHYSLLENLYPAGHPYAHTTIGSMADLDAASLTDVKNWFREHYGPNHAVLVLSGDIDVADAKVLVEKYFGGIPAGPSKKRPPISVPTLAAPKQVVLKDQVAQTLIYRAWAVPGINSKDAVPLDVAGDVLGGLASSRLDNILVRKEQLAVQVSAGVQQMADGGIFGIQVVVKPGVDADTVVKRLDEIMADYLAKGPSADEVKRVATSTVSSRLSGLESVGGFNGKAGTLAKGELFSGNPDFYKVQLQQLATVTPAQVKAAADKWLSRPALTIRVVPGERTGYTESKLDSGKTAKGGATATKTAAADTPVKGTRGPLPAVGQVKDIDFPAVQRTKLSNGIELIYAQRTAVPITQVVMSFDAGKVADPKDALGTGALTLASMTDATKHYDANALAEAKERFGARINGGSNADRTYLSLYTPSANLDGSVDLFADVVRNPAFDAPTVNRLRNQVLASIAQELKDPNGLARRAMPKLLFGADSPYAKLSAGRGDPAAIARLTPSDLAAFQNAWVRPDKAKVFVVSDRPIADVKAALEKAFGQWQGTGAAGVKDFSGAAASVKPQIVLIDRPNSPQSVILAGQMTGLKSTDNLLPVITSNEILGSGFLSRINMDLREAKHWSYGAGGGFRRYEYAVPYQISAPVQADKTGAAIASVISDVKEFLTTKGITAEEFDRTITGDVRSLAGKFETAGDVLGAMQVNDMFHRPDDYYATIAQKYRALTVPQLDAAARATIDPGKFVWVVVGDAAKVKPQLDSLGLPVEVISAGPPKVGKAPAGDAK